MIRAKLLRAMSVSPGREHERTGFGISFTGSARFDTGQDPRWQAAGFAAMVALIPIAVAWLLVYIVVYRGKRIGNVRPSVGC